MGAVARPRLASAPRPARYRVSGRVRPAVAQGLRLVDVSAFENGSGLAYTTIWEDGRPDQPSGDAAKAVVVPFMQKWAVPGLACSVARNGAVIAARTFGYANPITREVVTPLTRFRVASVSKPITSAAIFRLIEQGQLALTDRVFGAGARLGTTFGTTPYGMYITSLTIQHLLQHTAGGWQNDFMDPMFQQPTLSANDLISWTLDNRPLGNPPGTSFAYSNFGYCVLGRVIEAVTGQTYENYVRANVLGLSGVTGMHIAGDTGPERQWPEATYWGKDSDNPYGMRVRRMDAHGGWLGTATDLLQFGLRVDGFPAPPDILQAGTIATMTTASAANATYACGWTVDGAATRQHNGLLPGTLSILLRTAAQREWAAVCNAGIPGSPILGEFLATIATVDTLNLSARARAAGSGSVGPFTSVDLRVRAEQVRVQPPVCRARIDGARLPQCRSIQQPRGDGAVEVLPEDVGLPIAVVVSGPDDAPVGGGPSPVDPVLLDEPGQLPARRLIRKPDRDRAVRLADDQIRASDRR